MKIIFENTQGLEPSGHLIGYESLVVKRIMFDRLRNKLKGTKVD